MTLELQDQCSIGELEREEFVAELTQAAYPVALRHKAGTEWLDLELDLWKVLAQTVKKWEQRATLSLTR